MATERRRKQVARRVRERLSTLFLNEIKDPRAGFLTITGVEVNSDMTVATIFYSVLGGDSARSRMRGLLKHAHGYLRTEVAHNLDLRSAPQLVFKYDEGVDRAERIDQILKEVLPAEPEDGAPGEPPPAEE